MSTGMRWYWLLLQLSAIGAGIWGGRWVFDAIT